jgi:hypothetical protein
MLQSGSERRKNVNHLTVDIVPLCSTHWGRHAEQHLVGKSETDGEIDKAIFSCREDMIKANLKETGCEEVDLIEPYQFRI